MTEKFSEKNPIETMENIAKEKGWNKRMCACGFPQSKAPYHEHSIEREIYNEGFKVGQLEKQSVLLSIIEHARKETLEEVEKIIQKSYHKNLDGLLYPDCILEALKKKEVK